MGVNPDHPLIAMKNSPALPRFGVYERKINDRVGVRRGAAPGGFQPERGMLRR
jgi:hypothetical protein